MTFLDNAGVQRLWTHVLNLINTKTEKINSLAEKVTALENKNFLTLTTLTLPASAWTGSGTVYYQTVEVPGITSNSKLDLQPSPDQLRELLLAEISLTVANDAGTVTVFAIGDVPTSDYEMQVLIQEVAVNE